MNTENLILQKLESIEKRSANALNILDSVRRILEKMEQTGAVEKLELDAPKFNGKPLLEQLYLGADDLIRNFKSLRKAYDADKTETVNWHFDHIELEIERMEMVLLQINERYNELFSTAK